GARRGGRPAGRRRGRPGGAERGGRPPGRGGAAAGPGRPGGPVGVRRGGAAAPGPGRGRGHGDGAEERLGAAKGEPVDEEPDDVIREEAAEQLAAVRAEEMEARLG